MPPSGSNRTRTVFIGNISFDASEEELRALFSSVGPVLNLRLVVDRDTGKRKGFGFATMPSRTDERWSAALRVPAELGRH